MTRLTLLLFAGAWLMAASSMARADDGGTMSDQAHIASLASEHWCAADLAQDIDAKMSLFTEDAVLVMPGHEPLVGRDRIRAWQAQNYAMARHDCVGRVEIAEAEVRDGLGVVRGRFAGSVELTDGSAAFEQAGYFMNIFERDSAGNWRISRMIFTY